MIQDYHENPNKPCILPHPVLVEHSHVMYPFRTVNQTFKQQGLPVAKVRVTS